MAFVHLHVHSEYSLLEGACKIEPMVEQAKSMGFSALALTDKNVMYGAIPFYKACQNHGITPIIGIEIWVEPSFSSTQNHHSLLLLAKSRRGYHHLMKLSSLVKTSTFPHSAITKQQLVEHHEGLIALSSGKDGEIAHWLLQGHPKEAKQVASDYQHLFGNDFYLEVQDHGLSAEKQLNLDLVQCSKELGIPLVVTNDVHYLEKRDALAFDCLLCIKNGSRLEDENREKLPTDEYDLKSTQEMEKKFSWLPEALAQTEEIARQCHVDIEFGQPVLPSFPLPEGTDALQYLRKQCEKGLLNRYSRVDDDIKRRLNHELDVIREMQFSDYFLIVWDFMKFAHEQGMVTGPGRGSAAGSLVAYALGITNVDPMVHDLLFERFLNPERVTMPDIDIDFPDTRRDEVIQYVVEKYGREHVAQIITFGTLAARAAIRDIGRALGTSGKIVNALAGRIPSRPGITLDQAKEESEALQKILHESEEAAHLFDIAKRVEGLPRHASTHAAGVVISKNPLTNVVPVQSGQEGIPLTQYTMNILEEIGLLKMDFLGLRNLSLIEYILDLIQKGTGKIIRLGNIPFDNEKTFELFSSGNTTGIFQFESTGMRQVLRRLKPTHFEDIVAVNALYRPGPMENIPDYIARKHDKRKVTYFHEDLKSILENTYGVIVYQEQIMKIASVMAGFSLGEADLLRRAVSKKKKHILDAERKHFVEGCLKKGYDRHIAEGVYDLIVRFANYGFNRSHAVAYSVIAYQLAYLKANYSSFFMAALLTSVTSGHHKLEKYIHELKSSGVVFYPPSVNKSDMYFTTENQGIRFGLLAVKNIGTHAVKELTSKRSDRPYQHLFDLCARVSLRTVNRRALESLIFAGAMDEFGVNRARLMVSLDVAMERGELLQQKTLTGQMEWLPEYEQSPPLSAAEKLKFEKEALGFYLSGHPLDSYLPVLKKVEHSTIHDVVSLVKDSVVRVAGMVAQTRHIRTKKGERMVFFQLGDQSGDVEIVVFPALYRKHSIYFEDGQFLLVQGKLQKQDQVPKVMADKIIPLDQIKVNRRAEKPTALYLKIDHDHRKKDILEKVKKLLRRFHGNVEVILHYEDENRTLRLSESFAVDPSEECLTLLGRQLHAKNVVLKK